MQFVPLIVVLFLDGDVWCLIFFLALKSILLPVFVNIVIVRKVIYISLVHLAFVFPCRYPSIHSFSTFPHDMFQILSYHISVFSFFWKPRMYFCLFPYTEPFKYHVFQLQIWWLKHMVR